MTNSNKVAGVIVEHLESHNWKIEPGPAREGHATLVSRIVRQELHDLDRGGPVQRCKRTRTRIIEDILGANTDHK